MRRTLIAGLTLAAAGALGAQTGPVIRTSGEGVVALSPDWAVVSVAVNSRAETAAEASRTNQRTVDAVWEAVTRAGVPRDSVKTLSSGVQPIVDYQEDRRVIGYEAHTSLQIPVRDLARLGVVLDAALSAGATELHGVQPRSSREVAVRAEALASAVASARADAEALAEAAGGRLGPLLELSTSGAGGPQPMLRTMEMQMQARQGPSMPDLTVHATVSATWRFIPVRPRR